MSQHTPIALDELQIHDNFAPRSTLRLKQLEKKRSLALFASWCASRGEPTLITIERYRGFEDTLKAKFSPEYVRRALRHLYELGIGSSNLETRDFFFDNFPDRRTIDQIVRSPWWPNISRALAIHLAITERNRVIRELDNFFRWRERTSDLDISVRIKLIFLAEGVSPRTEYERLSRLCVGLEAILPGDRDLLMLRSRQRELFPRVWAGAPRPRVFPDRIAEVEAVLANAVHKKTGMPLKIATLSAYRKALNLHFNLQMAAANNFECTRATLDIFADHVLANVNVRYSTSEPIAQIEDQQRTERGWSYTTAITSCERLSQFISDRVLKKNWNHFVQSLKSERASMGEMKQKERALAKRPLGLESLFVKGMNLCLLADAELNIQRRHGMISVVGSLGILLFYPLRRADLLKLRIGKELKMSDGRWHLEPDFAQKTDASIDPLVLPREANDFIEICLLSGADRARLLDVYNSKFGQPYLISPRRLAPYQGNSFSDLFARWMWHRPHIIRSIWCDALVAQGASRSIISAMLQHKSIISQEDYEIFATKIRRMRTLEKLRSIADSVTTSRLAACA